MPVRQRSVHGAQVAVVVTSLAVSYGWQSQHRARRPRTQPRLSRLQRRRSFERYKRHGAIVPALDDGEAAEQERKRPLGPARQAFDQEPHAEGREHRQREKGNDDRPPGDAQAVQAGDDAAQPVVRPGRHQPHAVNSRFRAKSQGDADHRDQRVHDGEAAVASSDVPVRAPSVRADPAPFTLLD